MRADRLLSIILILQQRGHLTAGELAARLEVAERTVYRDVEALCLAGVPIYTQSGPHGGIFMDADYRVALTGLSRLEVQSLAVGGTAMPLRDLGLGEAREDSYLKVLGALPALQRAEAERIHQRIYLDPLGWFQRVEDHPHLLAVQQAVLDDEEIEFLYEKAGGEVTRRTLQPYGLVCKANVWYVVGRAEGIAWRTYRLSRFRGLRLAGRRFERETGFNLRDHWEASSRTFEDQFAPGFVACLRVHPETLAYFEWYLTGRYARHAEPDDRGWWPLDVQFYSLQEARMTVIGLARRVAVIGPEALRQDVLDAARALLAGSLDDSAALDSSGE